MPVRQDPGDVMGHRCTGARVARGGTKSFVFQYSLNGQNPRLTVGSVDSWDIDRARAEGRRLGRLVDQGIDPRQDKVDKKAKQEAKRAEVRRKEATVGEAWTAYLESRCFHWSERYYRDHVNFSRLGGEPKKRGQGRTTAGPLAPLMSLRLVELTAEIVHAWLQSEAGSRATQARQAFGAFRTFLVWCEDQSAYRGLASPDACTTRIARQELPKKSAKSDALQREQLHAWFEAIRTIGNPVIAAYLQALLLTGARREELATLTWENLDLQWSSLAIRDKADGERTIPLTPYVAALLDALPRRNEWVFSSSTAASGRL
jgi:integrase